jgi:hypothetical protein
MTRAGFETAIPAIGRQQTHALDRAATGGGRVQSQDRENLKTGNDWSSEYH